MERPDRDELFMATANLWSLRGTCSRLHVGCVVARDSRILVQGYNGTPAGMKHCEHDCICGFTDPIYQPPEVHSTTCAFVTSCKTAVHAEANTIAHAARNGTSLLEGTLYSTHMPCLNCAMLIVNAGIKRVVYKTVYRDTSGIKLLDEAFVRVTRYDRVGL